MFERVTGFFRRFRSKRKTSETAVLGPDDGGFDDFGLDDADFGDTIGTGELGESPDSSSDDDADFGADFGDEFDSGGDDSGEGLDSLSGVDTFESLGADSGAGGSLAGGSGENLLEDSQPLADTFESLPGVDTGPSSGSSDSGGFDEEGFEDFGSGLDDLASSGEPEDLDADLPMISAGPAKLRKPVVAAAAVGGLVLGAVLSFVLPLFMGSGDGPPIEQQLQKADSDLRRGERDLRNYQKLGGLAAIEQLKVDLEAARAEFAKLDELKAVLDDARQTEQAYDAVVAAGRDAERVRGKHEVARQALVAEIRKAQRLLVEQRTTLVGALEHYQRNMRAMEASAVVADAFDEAELAYVRDRAHQMITPVSGGTVGE